jgi:hypothetical protein
MKDFIITVAILSVSILNKNTLLDTTKTFVCLEDFVEQMLSELKKWGQTPSDASPQQLPKPEAASKCSGPPVYNTLTSPVSRSCTYFYISLLCFQKSKEGCL